jgi:phosphate:Na+ symporter
VGSALAGFGLLFLGIAMLQQGFGGIAERVQLPTGTGAGAVLAQLAVGLALTVLMQSSSAAMTVTLTAAQGGLLDAQGAAAVVIGANLGTTVTAVLAALGATANARRAAAAHVAFNLVTGAVALLLLPWLLGAIDTAAVALELPPEPAAQLALFHTVFNVLGVLLMLPLAAPLTRFLERRFRAQADDDSRPQFLDDNVLAVPALAVDALAAEIARLGGHAGQALSAAAGTPAAAGTTGTAGTAGMAGLGDATGAIVQARVVETLAPQVARFVERLNRSAMGPLSSARLVALLQALRGHESAALLARTAAVEGRGQAFALAGAPAAPALATLAALGAGFEQAVQAALASADDEAGLPATIEARYAALKRALLTAGAEGALPMSAMDQSLDRASALHRGLQQWRAARAAEQAARPGSG